MSLEIPHRATRPDDLPRRPGARLGAELSARLAAPRLLRDRVLLTIAALLFGLWIILPDQAPASLAFTFDALVGIAPFLLLSAVLAALLKATGFDKTVALAFAGREWRAILLAALFGALSPFCSCGVVPLIAGLLAGGVPLAPVMAFWLASPIMDPEMFVLTAAGISLDFALVKTAAAVALGVGGGFATWMLTRAGGLVSPLRRGSGCGGCAARAAIAGERPVWDFWRDPARRRQFVGEASGIGWFLLRWLALAFLLESLMVAYMPADQVAAWLGADSGWTAVPLAVAVGVPAYLNGYAAIPLIGGLMDLGMAPGAALAFVVAGSVTSIPAAAAVFALVRRAVFLWYLGLALAGSLIVGFAYQLGSSIP